MQFFVPLLVKLLGEGDNFAVGLYEFDGLALQFGEDGHGLLFGEVLSEGFQQQVVVYGDGAVVGIKGGHFVDEDVGVLVHDKHLEGCAEDAHLDEC